MREVARCSASAAAPSSEAARLLLLLPPLVLALLVGAVSASVCDTANCGMGNCSERPGPLPPNYACQCDPGWSNAFKLPFAPCIVPDCSFNSACLKLNLSLTPPWPPTDVCSFVSCGAGGDCKTGGGGAGPLSFSYSCECHPGYANLLNITTLPCVNCFLGDECYALGLGPPPPPPAPAVPARPAPAPSRDHNGTSQPSAPPSGTKGSVSSPSLRQLLLLLLVTVAVVKVV